MVTSTTSSPIKQASDEILSMNRWIFETIRPFIKGRTLEISSGINSLCPLFIECSWPIHLSDTNPLSIQTLRQAYKDNEFVRSVHDFNFTASNFKELHPDTLDVFDTVIALNISMSDFGKMVGNIKYVLPQGGTLVIIFPAYTSIYHGLDQNLSDWKRYNRKPISEILRFSFSILKVRYFNFNPEAASHSFVHSGLSALLIVKKD